MFTTLYDIMAKGHKQTYEELIEQLKKTPLYADGRYDKAVSVYTVIKNPTLRDDGDAALKSAKACYGDEYNRLSFLKKAELLTNITHMQVDTVLVIP